LSDIDTHRRLLVASPRGFCAGVERAIDVVEQLLAASGPPIYVRKEIVHNQAVVRDFRERGVVFVEELEEVPDGATVVFSAHGISPAVREQAAGRALRVVDATCPLVTKVHKGVLRHARAGRHIVLIGHEGHDEVLGTLGEAPDSITLVTSLADVAELDLPADGDIAYVTQTTLSVDETAAIVAALRERYPDLVEPRKSDICYATQNRQDAVKELVRRGVTYLLVVGSKNSSNSQRLCEVARRAGIAALLIDGPEDLETAALEDHGVVGLTAGASAPEHLVAEVADELARLGFRRENVRLLEESVRFAPPPGLETSTR
jgi:4-hydroxy-3-methylbut-2-enyl diphosphate reductase